MKRILKYFLFGFVAFVLIFTGYFLIGSTEPAKEISWGVSFSQKYATDLGLDWKETYLALLEDLGVRRLRVAAHWDLLEPEKGEHRFEDIDWKIKEAEKRGAKILLVIGVKTTRWPEYHIPEWVVGLDKEEQQERILNMLEKIVLRYRDRASIWAWQVENEPLLPFPFGVSPLQWRDKNFLKKEIALVRSLDPTRPIVLTDTGEFSFWFDVARLGDIVGVSIYRRVWSHTYITYPFRPIFYYRRARIIKRLFGKEVFCSELQAEPWGPAPVPYISLEEQKKTMNLEKFRENIEFAKKTGFDKFLLWGAEWWYWLKVKHGEPEIWNEAKKLFQRLPEN